MRNACPCSASKVDDSAVLALLQDMVAIPSVNPSALGEDHSCVGELRMVEYLESHLGNLGACTERFDAQDGRPNLVASVRRGSSSRHLLLEAHTDTVGTAGMTIAPFGGGIRNGRLFGRGACDAKGPLAAYLEAFRWVIESDLPFDGRLSLAACMGEEDGCHGAQHLIRGGFGADAAIVAEPTALRLVNAHKGALWWRCTLRGKAGHGAEPAVGINAISRMARVLGMIENELIPSLQERPDPVLGSPTLNVGTISGGQKINIIPDECAIEIDRRLVSDEDPDEILKDFGRRVAALAIPEHDVTIEQVQRMLSFSTHIEQPIVRAMSLALEELGESPLPTSVNYCSDAGEFAAAGVPSIVFGPGDIRQAHTADESVDLLELRRAVPILVHTIARFFGLSGLGN